MTLQLRLRWFLLSIVAISCCVAKAQPSPEKIDSLFASWNGATTPGGAVAIVDHGKVTYRKAFGMADVSHHQANTPETQFELASMAKQFTAMCIALLEEQGKISAEDDIHQFYPEFHFGEPVRIKNLLDHTSGIREGYVLALLGGKVNLKGEVPKRRNTKAFIIQLLTKERDLNFSPGSEMVYTNVNYILLGDIVERISGQTLREFADSAIFKPLGMKNTVFRDQPDMRGTNESYSYFTKGKKFKKANKLGGIVGDHNLITTIDDLTLWANNFRSNKLGKGNPALLQKITSSSYLNNGDSTRYGYGLNVSRDRGVLKVGHGGDDGSSTSIITFYPEHDLAVIVLANSSRYRDTESKGNTIGEIYLKEYFRKASVPTDEKYVTLSKAVLEKHAGLYYLITPNGLGRFRKIAAIENSLYSSGHPRTDGIKYSALTADHFVFRNEWGVSRLAFNDSSKTPLLTHQWNEYAKENYQVIDQTLVIPYSDYKGAFMNESTNATIKIRNKKGKLVARKGIIRIPLIAFEKDLFYGYEHDALFFFSRDASGKIDRLKINAGDFRNFKMKKK